MRRPLQKLITINVLTIFICSSVLSSLSSVGAKPNPVQKIAYVEQDLTSVFFNWIITVVKDAPNLVATGVAMMQQKRPSQSAYPKKYPHVAFIEIIMKGIYRESCTTNNKKCPDFEKKFQTHRTAMGEKVQQILSRSTCQALVSELPSPKNNAPIDVLPTLGAIQVCSTIEDFFLKSIPNRSPLNAPYKKFINPLKWDKNRMKEECTTMLQNVLQNSAHFCEFILKEIPDTKHVAPRASSENTPFPRNKNNATRSSETYENIASKIRDVLENPPSPCKGMQYKKIAGNEAQKNRNQRFANILTCIKQNPEAYKKVLETLGIDGYEVIVQGTNKNIHLIKIIKNGTDPWIGVLDPTEYFSGLSASPVFRGSNKDWNGFVNENQQTLNQSFNFKKSELHRVSLGRNSSR